MFDQIVCLFAFCSLGLAAFGLGRPLVRGLGLVERDGLGVAVWSVALGLTVAGLGIFALGWFGWLYPSLLGGLTILAAFWGLGEVVWGGVRAAQRRAFDLEKSRGKLGEPSPQQHGVVPPRWLSRSMVLAAGIAAAGSLVGALAPPTAGDALCYHLDLPKTFLLKQHILPLPYHDNATYPLMTEMWYLWALALDGGVCAQLVHWGLGLLLAAATALLARGIIGPRWAPMAAALVLLTPGVNNQMTAPLNDVALAAMTTLAVAAWWRAVVAEEDRRWLLMAGLAAGTALGTKYLALVFAAAVALTWIGLAIHRPYSWRPMWQGLAVASVVAWSVGGIWYVRALKQHGNPVFPLLGEVLPERRTDSGSGGPEDLAAHPPAGDPGNALAVAPRSTLPASKAPLGRGLVGLVTAPWQITMQPQRFGGRGHQLGILPLVALPGLWFCRRLWGLGSLCCVATFYGILWYLLRQNIRFLMPIIPLLAVMIVWVWMEMRGFPRRPRLVAAATFALIVATLSVVPLVRARDQFAVALGWQTRREYLAQHEPTYRAATVANAWPKEATSILSQDYRAFYFEGLVTRENVYRRTTGYDRQISEPALLSRQLRQAGFTHLLLAETIGGSSMAYDPTLSRLVDAQLRSEAAGRLQVLTRYRFRDRDGAIRQYRLILLREPPPGP